MSGKNLNAPPEVDHGQTHEGDPLPIKVDPYGRQEMISGDLYTVMCELLLEVRLIRWHMGHLMDLSEVKPQDTKQE